MKNYRTALHDCQLLISHSKNTTSTNITYLFTTYYHASFEDLKVNDSSGAPTTSSFIHYVIIIGCRK